MPSLMKRQFPITDIYEEESSPVLCVFPHLTEAVQRSNPLLAPRSQLLETESGVVVFCPSWHIHLTPLAFPPRTHLLLDKPAMTNHTALK